MNTPTSFTPPPPPFDIDTMEPIEAPWLVTKEWIPDDDPDLKYFNQERNATGAEAECFDQPVRHRLLTAIALRATAVGVGGSLGV